MIISDWIKTLINVNISSIFTNIIVSIYNSKITTNLKNTFYEDEEIQKIIKDFYQIKKSLTNYHNFTIFLEDYNRYGAENFNVY